MPSIYIILEKQPKVDVYVRFKNEKANHLGMPMPKGKVRVYKKDDADGTLEFVGEDVIDHTPKDETVLVKEVQYDHLGLEVMHVDFARVSLDEKVEVTVPLELKGEPKGEADGGVLQQIITDLEIECVVTEIPDKIRHNVSEMGMDSVLHVKDLHVPAGVKVMHTSRLAPTASVPGAPPETIWKPATVVQSM